MDSKGKLTIYWGCGMGELGPEDRGCVVGGGAWAGTWVGGQINLHWRIFPHSAEGGVRTRMKAAGCPWWWGIGAMSLLFSE